VGAQLFLIAVLIIILVVLIVYNKSLSKKLQTFSNIDDKIKSLNVIQDFMSTIGEELSVDDKIRKINEILLERYNIKYSTIVVFDGAEYVIKASNVDEKHWEALRALHKEDIFKDSISSAQTKYITVNTDNEKLPYQKMEFGRAKSAMFLPLYIENIYIGYWIIESGEKHAFDKLDTTILEVVRENIINVIKNVSYQSTIESIHRKDKFTGLYSAEYLYGKGKKIIDKYATSTVCMFKLINIEEINDKLGRKAGDKILTKISNIIKQNISPEYIFVRYMGPKFVIVFSGAEKQGVAEFMKNIKLRIEQVVINLEEKDKEKSIKMRPIFNFVLSTYYKGTGIEGVTKKLEEYLDKAPSGETNISYI
jgi:diguanylate cyclase (GGDEF)-like protein